MVHVGLPALVALALAGYAGGFYSVFEDVSRLRARVSDRVGWLGMLEGAEGPAEVRKVQAAARAEPITVGEDAAALDAALADLADALVEPKTSSTAARARAATLLRAENRADSVRIGERVDQARYAVIGGLTLGAGCLAALLAALRALATSRREKRRLHLLTEATHDGLWEWDLATGVVVFAGGWTRMTGVGGATLEDWLRRVHPEDAAALRATLDRHVERGEGPFEAEYRLLDAAGTWRWVLSRGLAERDAAGRAERVACWTTDVDQLRRAHEAKQRSAALAHVADATGLAVLTLGAGGHPDHYNSASVALAAPWGSPSELWAKVREKVRPPGTSTCPTCGGDQPRGRRVVSLPGPAGAVRHLEAIWTGHSHVGATGAPAEVVALADVTERVNAEELSRAANERVRASEAELRAVLDAMPDVVIACTEDRVLFSNAAARVMFGAGGLATVLPTLRSAAGRGSPVRVNVVGGGTASVEICAPAAVEWVGEPARLIVAHDVGARVRVESQLRAAERMIALGGLAAGLAHEINNPLTYVIGNLELAAEGYGDVAGRVSRALGGAVRVRQVVAQLRAIATAGAVELGPVELGPVADHSIGVATGVGLPPARVIQELDPTLVANGNGIWIGQILVNLLTNALLALGTRALERRRVVVRAERVGDEVRIDVADSGPGVDESVRAQLFDPFVSTRARGEGSGLGLYICRELAGRMGGRLELRESTPEGATFSLWLRAAEGGAALANGTERPAPVGEPTGSGASGPPAFEETVASVLPAPAAAPRRAATAPVSREARGGVGSSAPRGRVLVVDDEVALTEVIRGFLEHHDVTVATDGPAAWREIEASDWDVVILDLHLGPHSGISLWRELADRGSVLATRVIFMTGGSMTPEVARFVLDANATTLLKPFDLRELRRLVDEQVASLWSSRA